MWRRIAFLSIFFFYPTLAASTPTCVSGFTLTNNKCLKLFTNLVNHASAERTCMDYGATLVNVKNAIDNRAISSFVGNSASLLWIGLFCTDSDPAKCSWDDSVGTASQYNSFSAGFPLVEVGRCVYYSSQGALAGKWLNGDCDNELRSFICELPTTFEDSCMFNYNGNCYTFHSASSFADAQTTCEEECGNLASIHSANENRYINTLVNRVTHESLLVGASYSSSNTFNWADGSAWDYENIDPNFPIVQKCLAISNGVSNDVASGSWYSTNCEFSHSYVCKRPAGTQCDTTSPQITVTHAPSNPSGCNGGTLMAPGVITSLDYPNWYDYTNEYNCSYHLATLGSFNILLKVKSFQSGDRDFLRIYDGDSSRSPMLGAYSGNRPNKFDVLSTGNTMYLTFQPAYKIGYTVYSGFKADFMPYSH